MLLFLLTFKIKLLKQHACKIGEHFCFVLFCFCFDFQGGNMSFIFLEQSLNTRAPDTGNRCKVVFSSPKHCLTPREVMATVKNPYTIKVRVPHCPSKFQLTKH